MACEMWDTRIAEMAYFLLIDTIKGYNFAGNMQKSQYLNYSMLYIIPL